MVQTNPCYLPKPVKSWDSLAEVLSLHRKHVPLTTQSILQDHRDVVEGLRHISCSSFTVNSTAVPVQHISRRIPVALQNEVKAKLTDLETKGIIKKETAPTDWISNWCKTMTGIGTCKKFLSSFLHEVKDLPGTGFMIWRNVFMWGEILYVKRSYHYDFWNHNVEKRTLCF